MRVSGVSLILILSFTAVANAQSHPVDPHTWNKVNACTLTFILPPSVREVKAYPVDSCVKHYRGDDVAIELDVSFSPHTPRTEKLFKESLSGKPDSRVDEVEISGVRSLVGSYYKSDVPAENNGMHYYSVLLVPSIGKDKRGLTMRIYSRTPDGPAISRRVFTSVGPKR